MKQLSSGIYAAVKAGKLKQPFNAAMVEQACPGWAPKTYNVFLRKHAVGSGRTTELLSASDAGGTAWTFVETGGANWLSATTIVGVAMSSPIGFREFSEEDAGVLFSTPAVRAQTNDEEELAWIEGQTSRLEQRNDTILAKYLADDWVCVGARSLTKGQFIQNLQKNLAVVTLRGRKLSAAHRVAIKAGIARAKKAQGKAW